MISANMRQARDYERALRGLNRVGIPYAEAGAANTAAFETMRDSKIEMGQRMVLRNKWSERSVRVSKATPRDTQSEVGSVAEYLEKQEKGAVKNAGGRHGVPIATRSASGEGRGSAPRQRLVRKPNRMPNIQLNGRRKVRSNSDRNRKARNAYAIKQAAGGGNRYVFLDLGKRKGIFRVYGGKRKPRIEMMQDLSFKTVRTPANPWLWPAAQPHAQRITQYYAQALRYQLRRYGWR